MRKPLMVLWAFYLFLLLQDCSSTNIDNDLTFEDAPARPEAPGRPGLGHGFSLTSSIVNFAKRVKRDLFDFSFFGSSKTTPSDAVTNTETTKETSRSTRSTDSVSSAGEEMRTTPNGENRGSTVSKRQTRPTDDEDELGGRGGSGEELLTGSGFNEAITTSEAPKVTESSSRHEASNIYVLYRMIVFVEEFMRPALGDSETDEFKSFAKNFTTDLDYFFNEDPFSKIPGKQQSSVINISPASDNGFIRVTVDIGSSGYDDVSEIRSRIRRQVENMGRLGSHILRIDSDHPFSFQKFTGSSTVECSASQLPCSDGVTCVAVEARCNSVVDCPDGSDEIGCGWNVTSTKRPPDGQENFGITDGLTDAARFQPAVAQGRTVAADRCRADDKIRCPDGSTLICSDQKCDGVDDCPGESEEAECPLPTQPPSDCLVSEFMCDVTRCIPLTQKCDGFPHCRDGTDEQSCPATPCSISQWTCSDGTCIEAAERCDGTPQCPDSSDEESCPNRCPADNFRCADGSCVLESQVCDHNPDCPSGDDENDCQELACLDNEFRCNNSQCIKSGFVCDGVDDCRDNSDERDCPEKDRCQDGDFRCADNNQCIRDFKRCDSKPDCADGSDERNCGPCRNDEFECRDGKCIDLWRKCDRFNDCGDYSDEENCNNTPVVPVTSSTARPYWQNNCSPYQFSCRSGNECVPKEATCDGRWDCQDGSDEENCIGTPTIRLVTTPTNQTIEESREVVFQCRDEGLGRHRVRWSRVNGAMPPRSRDLGNRLEMPNIQRSHSGAYVCEVIDVPPNTPGARATVYLQVVPFLTPTSPPINAGCGYDEATCYNRQCIKREKVCDGFIDCSDGSDESRCAKHSLCEPNMFACDDKECIYKMWRCDGQNDCLDGSDERGCPQVRNGTCLTSEFACKTNNQCIPKGMRCDKTSDCIDGSDEVGCRPPVIVQPPPQSMSLEIGSTLRVECTASGEPTPEISWRLNWRHVAPKCTSVSEGGRGILTCPDLTKDDEGAYSCEALGMGRPVFARPDLHLRIGLDRPECPRGQFNEASASNASCTACFCFGHSSECSSANLHTYRLPPPRSTFRLAQVITEPDIRIISEEISPVQRNVRPLSNNGFQISASSGGDTGRYQYYSMPENTHLNNQLNSYGGYINYEVTPSGESSGRRRFLDIPDIILEGNGRILTYKWRYPFVRDRANAVSVRIYPQGWMVSIPSRNINRPATRADIMTALANVDALLIRVQYFEGPEINTIISDITMDSARPTPTGLEKATTVEQCVCPAGYTGLSCERCADNYVQQTGGYLHTCEIPPCREGFYGAPDRGIPCRPCACPYPSPVRSCRLDFDDQPTCDCPFGYSGRRCEIPPSSPQTTCSEAGSRYPSDNGTCECKDYTTGPTCDACAPNSFHLAATNQHGCIKCFCFGQTDDCDSSSLYRDEIQLRFFRDTYGVSLSRMDDLANKNVPEVDPSASELYFDQFDPREQDAYYWVLPRMFLDNKVTSYGGKLVYRIRYTPTPGGQSSKNSAPDVKLVSEKLAVERFHYTQQVIEPDRDVTITVPLLEQHWQSADGAASDREHLMMALSDISAILIKATYTTGTQKAALVSVSLETATSRNTGRSRALEVEQCRCPTGYVGTSCENCAPGYKYSGDGTYKGICEPCQCNGASEDCDPDTGICRNCREGRIGDFCERCPDDYTLTPDGCKRENGGSCYCDPRGSQSEECRDNRCVCKTYVEGDQCDRCAPGYFHLSEDNPRGCTQCYCSGVSSSCSSSNFNMGDVPHFIIDSNHNLSLSDGSRIVERDSFTVNSAMSEVGYALDGRYPRLFWSLPGSFTGDKIHSYSGSLQFSQRFTSRNPDAMSTRDNDIIITGSGMSIYYTFEEPLQAGQVRASSVQLKEGKWRRLDPRTSHALASRNEILRILSQVETILVRASLTPEADETFIRDISLGVASPDVPGPRADDVEVCDCPDGYTGSSCQNCVRNHYRNYDNSCLRCPCVHNETCHLDSSTNQVKCDCSSRYVGDHCETEASRPYPTSSPSPAPIRVTIDVQPSGIVPEGESVVLYCTGDSFEGRPVILNWSRRDGRLPQQHVLDNSRGTLTIYNVHPSDSGVYVCTATDGITSETQSSTLNIGEPAQRPSVRIVPSPVEIMEGETTTITCETFGTPEPQIEWRRVDGRPMSRSVRVRDKMLRIYAASRIADEGSYECIARNEGGESREMVTVSILERTTVPQIRIQPAYLNATEGQSVTITCQVQSPTTQFRLEWIRERRLPMPPNVIARGGELVFNNIRTTDSGVYICVATSLQTGRKVGEGSANILVSRIGPPPILSIYPERQTLDEGETAVLTCSGLPAGQEANWYKTGSTLPSKARISGSELIIPDIEESDQAVYNCEVTTDYYRARATAFIEVRRRGVAPTITILPNSTVDLNEGESWHVQCRADGDPRPTVRWERKGSSEFPRNVIRQNPGVLRFERVTLSESDDYTCIGENSAGRTSAVLRVSVMRKPRVRINPRGQISAVVGQRLELYCQATGVPAPEVTWHIHTRYPQALPSDRGEPGSAVFRILSVSQEDEGTYECTATNPAGQERDSVFVIVNDSEGGQAPESEDFEVDVGGSSEIRCSLPSEADLTVEWRRGDGRPLGRNVVPYDDRLVISNAHENDAGDYVCLYKDSKGIARKTATARLRVVERLQIRLIPPRQTVAPGDNPEIRCVVEGDANAQVRWEAVNRNMPASAVVTGESILFRSIQESDAGRYTCTAVGAGGFRAESTAEVVVKRSALSKVPPTGQNFAVKFVGEKVMNKTEGSTVLLQCQYNIPANVSWTKYEGSLPPYSTQDERGDLRIVNLRPEDSGTYVCRGRTQWGLISSDTVRLNIIRAQNVRVFIEPSIDVIRVGDNVDLRCNSVGVFDSESRKWEKVGGALADNVQILDSTLRIRDVTSENAGLYRCWARKQNRQIVEDSFTLEVQGDSQKSYIERKAAKTQFAKVHEKIALQCDQGLEQPVKFSWTKNGQPLPNNTEGKIIFNDVLSDDAGYYMCVASNGEIKIEFPTFLVVRGSIPRFSQRSSSYLKLRSMHSAYLKFNIHVTIKPEEANGLILYNGGEKSPTTRDFVSLGLKNGYVELRFDVGSGEAVIISNVTVPMGKWSNITIRRERKEGRLWVNNRGPFIGTSPGRYQGLDLTEPLYLGSVPDYSAISSAAGFTSGFVGCISYLKINDEVEPLTKPLESSDVGDCDTCADQPDCRNNGVCQEATNEKGYVCLCPRGFKGDYCEQTGGACYTGLCNDGRCEDVDSSYECHCKLGKSGDNCERNIEVTVPAFHGKSYLAYPIPHIATDFSVGLEIARHDEQDGLLAYAAQYPTGGGDFISLAVKGNYAEFMVDTGSGSAVVRNPEFIKKNEKTTIVATHSAEDITLTVNGRTTRRPLDLGRKKGLNLNTALYVGGSAPWALKVNPMVGISNGFNGCILSLLLNGSPRNMLKNSIDSINIGECYEFSTRSGGTVSGERKEASPPAGTRDRTDNGLEGRPSNRGDLESERERVGDGDESGCPVERCQNGGKCDYTMGAPVCLCTSDFGGAYCQIKTNMCDLGNNPCGSTGICVKDTLEGYKCECLFGYTGKNCELETHITTGAKFSENSFVELPSSLFTHLEPTKEEMVSFILKTDKPEGLIFWQGTDADYILLGMKDGRLQAEISAGDVPLEITSTDKVDDSRPHRVVLKKKGSALSLTVDGKTLANVEESMPMRKLEANINWGGASDPWIVTNGRYDKGFEGCLIDLRFNDGPSVDLSQSQTFSRNVENCSRDLLGEADIDNEA